MTPLESLVATGTKLWLDSIDPEEIANNRAWGATGATSNPIIISDLIRSRRFDGALEHWLEETGDNSQVAWLLTDQLVREAQDRFHDVWLRTRGDDGWVSFELDPLIEDNNNRAGPAERAKKYVELGLHWGLNRGNRMIKVPATEAGLLALEELAAHGVALNVTLIFSERQYRAARESVWRGALRGGQLDRFKSVYSIFVSRVDVYTEQHVTDLSPSAQGMVGIVNAKRLWRLNQSFWAEKSLPLKQEIVFASTGTKKPTDPPWKYVQAFAGSDVQTNPPATNAAVNASGLRFDRQVDQLPQAAVLAEIDRRVDPVHLEETLMREGVVKFCEPQKALLELIASRRVEQLTSKR